MRIGLFLVVGLLLGGLLVALLVAAGIPWDEAGLLGAPLGLVFGAICIAARYPCQAAPLATTGPLRLAGTHASAAVVSVGIWAFVGAVLSRALEATGRWTGVGVRYRDEAPTLIIVGLLVFLLAVAMHYLVLALEAAREAQVRGVEARVLAREAELRALRAQVDPHFLFNSLNSIGTLTSEDPAAARRMCLLLAGFLRRSLVLGGRDRIPLQEELALADDYLAIEKVRFGARLQVEESIGEDTGACQVPPLILQPLIENAVRHGVAQVTGGGTLRLSARRAGDRLVLDVSNPRDPERVGRRGAGLGIDNVRGRLRTLFGETAQLEVEAKGESFRVVLTLPAIVAETGAGRPAAGGASHA
jgi:two-component system, LytTR family, sensor histidine kinase AlgZ